MSDKCRHDSAVVEGTHGRITTLKCESLCGEYFIQVRDGITSYSFTADEILALRAENAALKAANEQARKLLKDADEALRSSYQIAARSGRGTNWEAWLLRLENILTPLNAYLQSAAALAAGEEREK